jgi:hypothetical protein
MAICGARTGHLFGVERKHGLEVGFLMGEPKFLSDIF